MKTQADSDDEEWSTLKRAKTLKASASTKKHDKFKSQHVSAKAAVESSDDELDSDDEFYVKPPEFGDQFMACKPWLGAVKEPDEVPPINPTPPDERYEIGFVHGYKSDLTR